MMDIMELSRNRWSSILSSLGMPGRYLKNRHGPCPVCRGFDNQKPYRFDDKFGNGDHFCTHHGCKDGAWLACEFFGWSFKEAAENIRSIIGGCAVSEPKAEEKDVEKIKAGIQKIWGGAKSIGVMDDYLRSRGLSIASKALRGHPSLSFRHDDGSITKENAMVALVQGLDGRVSTIHRTYLLPDGSRVKKLYKVIPDTWLGGAIRLFPVHQDSGFIGLAEGIETAMAVAEYRNIPVWSTVTAQGMERWEPPEGIKRVSIFGDSDPGFAGQKAAYSLGERLTRQGIQTEVHLPKIGSDWLDFLNDTRRREAA